MTWILATVYGGMVTVVDEEGHTYGVLLLDTTTPSDSGESLDSEPDSRHLSQVNLPRR